LVAKVKGLGLKEGELEVCQKDCYVNKEFEVKFGVYVFAYQNGAFCRKN
jgi:hypothetical protein